MQGSLSGDLEGPPHRWPVLARAGAPPAASISASTLRSTLRACRSQQREDGCRSSVKADRQRPCPRLPPRILAKKVRQAPLKAWCAGRSADVPFDDSSEVSWRQNPPFQAPSPVPDASLDARLFDRHPGFERNRRSASKRRATAVIAPCAQPSSSSRDRGGPHHDRRRALGDPRRRVDPGQPRQQLTVAAQRAVCP